MDKKGILLNKVFEKILKDIKPSDIENKSIISNINTVTSLLKKIVPKDVEIMVTGSVSRGTNLKGNSDVDIFLLFKTGTTKESLTKLGLKYGKALVRSKTDRYEIKYAEHPYVRVYLNALGIKADIVPALKIQNAEQIATAVDRTPLHTNFINEKLTSKQKDEVRLLKYFLRSHGIYGAESKTSGFSGYLCEVLIYDFSSIKKLLNWACSLELPTVIYPKDNEESNHEEVLKKFNSDFVVIDPVDKNRNVAAVVSKESLSKFIFISRKLLENPSVEQFFGLKYYSRESRTYIEKFIKRSDLELYSLIFDIPDKSEEILWPQIKKVSGIILDYLKRNEFIVYFSLQWTCNKKGVILFVAPKQKLGSRFFKGPDVFNKKGIDEFIKSHKTAMGFIFSGTRLFALDTSYVSTLEDALIKIKKDKQIYSHKDINLSKALILKNKVPKELSESAYYEFIRTLSI